MRNEADFGYEACLRHTEKLVCASLHIYEANASYERSECIISAQADASLILKVAFLYYEPKKKPHHSVWFLFVFFAAFAPALPPTKKSQAPFSSILYIKNPQPFQHSGCGFCAKLELFLSSPCRFLRLRQSQDDGQQYGGSADKHTNEVKNFNAEG